MRQSQLGRGGGRQKDEEMKDEKRTTGSDAEEGVVVFFCLGFLFRQNVEDLPEYIDKGGRGRERG